MKIYNTMFSRLFGFGDADDGSVVVAASVLFIFMFSFTKSS